MSKFEKGDAVVLSDGCDTQFTWVRTAMTLQRRNGGYLIVSDVVTNECFDGCVDIYVVVEGLLFGIREDRLERYEEKLVEVELLTEECSMESMREQIEAVYKLVEEGKKHVEECATTIVPQDDIRRKNQCDELLRKNKASVGEILEHVMRLEASCKKMCIVIDADYEFTKEDKLLSIGSLLITLTAELNRICGMINSFSGCKVAE